MSYSRRCDRDADEGKLCSLPWEKPPQTIRETSYEYVICDYASSSGYLHVDNTLSEKCVLAVPWGVCVCVCE